MDREYIFAQLVSLPNATQYVEVTKYIEDLEQQVQKKKEAIDKAIEYLEEPNRDSFDYSKTKLLDILKEVSE